MCRSKQITLALFLMVVSQFVAAQIRPDDISISSTPVLDAAGPQQRLAIHAIYLIACKSSTDVGTGFLLSSGVLVTNQHVIGTCATEDIVAIAPDNTRVQFGKVVKDKDRDLALLKPSHQLSGGLELGSDVDPEPGTVVSTWGYPLVYNGIQPLLSVGYVAGFRNDIKGITTTKHLIVNGAFNHGNSGGPLMYAHDNRIIGVVVATYHMFPPIVEQSIKALESPGSGMSSGRFSWTDASGHQQPLMDNQVIGYMLEQFYQTTQVMIGEAISVSELRRYLKENAQELGLKPDTRTAPAKSQ
jgi:hypothetical protein